MSDIEIINIGVLNLIRNYDTISYMGKTIAIIIPKYFHKSLIYFLNTHMLFLYQF